MCGLTGYGGPPNSCTANIWAVVVHRQFCKCYTTVGRLGWSLWVVEKQSWLTDISVGSWTIGVKCVNWAGDMHTVVSWHSASLLDSGYTVWPAAAAAAACVQGPQQSIYNRHTGCRRLTTIWLFGRHIGSGLSLYIHISDTELQLQTSWERCWVCLHSMHVSIRGVYVLLLGIQVILCILIITVN